MKAVGDFVRAPLKLFGLIPSGRAPSFEDIERDRPPRPMDERMPRRKSAFERGIGL